MLVYQRLLFAAKSPRSAKWLFLNASRAAPAAAPRFGQRHSPLLARPGKRNRSATGTATKKNRWWSPSPRHILDIFAELVWKSRWRAQNLIVKHHVPMTEWQFWRWIMLDPLFQRQCSGSSMYHTWPTFGWFSEMIWIYLDIYLDISGYIWIYLDDLEHYHGRRNPDVTLHTLLFSVPLSSEPFGWVPAAGESNRGRSRFLHQIIGS